MPEGPGLAGAEYGSAMRYEVPIGAVGGGRGRRDVPAVLVGACLVVAVSALAAVAAPVAPGSESPSRSPSMARAAPASRSPTGPSAATGPPSRPPRPLPDELECGGLAPAACRRVVAAALAALPADAPPVVAASAWDSIVCGDTFDCPTRRLDRAHPLGSVAVSFAGGSPGAVVNVVEARFGDNIRLGTRAWLLDRTAIPPAAGAAAAPPAAVGRR